MKDFLNEDFCCRTPARILFHDYAEGCRSSTTTNTWSRADRGGREFETWPHLVLRHH